MSQCNLNGSFETPNNRTYKVFWVQKSAVSRMRYKYKETKINTSVKVLTSNYNGCWLMRGSFSYGKVILDRAEALNKYTTSYLLQKGRTLDNIINVFIT